MKKASYVTSIKHITRHVLLQDILTKERIILTPKVQTLNLLVTSNLN